MTRYAEGTSVSVEQTRAQIEGELSKLGAEERGFMVTPKAATVVFSARGRHVRFVLPLPDPAEKRFTVSAVQGKPRSAEAQRKEWGAECRELWRALLLSIKAKRVAIDSKITTFEQEFYAWIVLPNGRTIHEETSEQVKLAYSSGQMPKAMLEFKP